MATAPSAVGPLLGRDPGGRIALALIGGSHDAYRYLLLQWIARHVDQADCVELWLAPAEQPETRLADRAVKTESDNHAATGRVLDVARLSGMATGPGCFPVGNALSAPVVLNRRRKLGYLA